LGGAFLLSSRRDESLSSSSSISAFLSLAEAEEEFRRLFDGS
jgi:hypothetical protein